MGSPAGRGELSRIQFLSVGGHRMRALERGLTCGWYGGAPSDKEPSGAEGDSLLPLWLFGVVGLTGFRRKANLDRLLGAAFFLLG